VTWDDSCTTDVPTTKKPTDLTKLNFTISTTTCATYTFEVRLAPTKPWYSLTKWACEVASQLIMLF
jgi:hypothetical protein